MNLLFAEACAARLVEWLNPFCERLSVAGSVRRRKAEPGDIDLVAIPKIVEEMDLFGKVSARRNAAWREIDRRATAESWTILRAGADLVSLVAKGVQVDIWWAEPAVWGSVLLSRTGSIQHNIWLAEYAKARGGKWHPGIGLYLANHRVAATEDEIYAALGLDPIPPDRREAHLLPFAGLIRRSGAGAA
jgi:DNA polymerase (family 10)